VSFKKILTIYIIFIILLVSLKNINNLLPYVDNNSEFCYIVNTCSKSKNMFQNYNVEFNKKTT